MNAEVLVPDAQTAGSTGFKKFDSGKSRMELLDPGFLLEMGRVMAMGAQKYGEGNWELCEDPSRYLGAMLRHVMEALEKGSDCEDVESELATMAHAAINCMMAWRCQITQRAA